MIDFILNIIAVFIAIELREALYQLFKRYKFNVIKKNVNSEVVVKRDNDFLNNTFNDKDFRK